MTDTSTAESSRLQTRSTIIDVAARLLKDHGEPGITTRGVAEAAGVQAPTIYRIFGDKDGLLDAVAEHVMATYVEAKTVAAASESEDAGDPVGDLRAGWEMHVEFGLANPTLFRLLNVPSRDRLSPATASGIDVLRSRVRRVAASGRLRVGEQVAVDLIQAAGIGAVLTVLGMPPEARDGRLAEAMFDAVTREILTDTPVLAEDDARAAAVTFRTIVPRLRNLSDTERALMTEWLDRAVG